MSYKQLRVFLPDTVHFHKRNFASLIDFFNRHKIEVTSNSDINSWVGLFGDYSSKVEHLSSHMNRFNNIKPAQLFNYHYETYNLWELTRAELLAWFLPKIEFNEKVSVRNDEEQLRLMCEIDIVVVKSCFAAAIYFLLYWSSKFKTIRLQTHSLIFSGSQIYNKTLLEILKHSQTVPVVMEHFFTGYEYYFEERYLPIPNASDLKTSYYKFPSSKEHDRNRIKAINKLILSNNKNVKKSQKTLDVEFKNGEVITLVGQVVNDYSIIETATVYLNSITFYKEIINKATLNGYNVIFKTHPWERNKTNINAPFTQEIILSWIDSHLSKAQKERVVVTEHADLENVMLHSDYVVGLCSQGLLESCFDGFKPIQFGNAFFGGRSFTYDYNSVDDFINDMNKGLVNGTLTLNEFKAYENFMVEALIHQLVSTKKSGILNLESKFSAYPLISLIEKESSNALSQPVALKEDSVPVLLPAIIHNSPESKNVVQAKYKKLKKDPKGFLKDSDSILLQYISRML